MSTTAEIQHALRLLTLEEREVIAAWLEGDQDEEVGGPMRVAEPTAAYAVDPPPYMTFEEYLNGAFTNHSQSVATSA